MNRLVRFFSTLYQKKYFTIFSHPKKIFFLDISLLFFVLAIGAATIYWTVYRPHQEAHLLLHIQTPTDRIVSGEIIPLTISYTNITDDTLSNAVLEITTPPGFITEQTLSNKITTPTTNTIHISLDPLPPHNTQTTKLTGQFISTPHTDMSIEARMQYTLPSHTAPETSFARGFIISRGSVLKTTLDLPSTVISPGSTPIHISVQNTGDTPVSNITIPLHFPDGVVMHTTTITTGTIQSANWTIPTLLPHTTTTLTGTLRLDLPDTTLSLRGAIVPTISINNTTITQTALPYTTTVHHPPIDLSATWQQPNANIVPGSTETLTIHITNSDKIPLHNATLKITLPSTIIADSIKKYGTYQNDTLLIGERYFPELSVLPPHTTIDLSIPILIQPRTGTLKNLTLSPTIEIHGTVLEESSSVFVKKIALTPRSIGTDLSLKTTARYYTAEGDQIGRGPLPPEPGKETVYWAIISIHNTTNDVTDVTLTAHVPPSIRWTGAMSVSQGATPAWNETTRTLTWRTSRLSAHDDVILSAEVGLTPTEKNRRAVPLLTDISLSGTDDFVHTPLTIQGSPIDSALENDTRAQDRLDR